MGTIIYVMGVVVALLIGMITGLYIQPVTDNTQRGSLKGATPGPVSATVNAWDGVKLARWCDKGDFGVYLLPDGNLKAAARRGAPFGSIVIDPEKVC